jgi:hypothetical protein
MVYITLSVIIFVGMFGAFCIDLYLLCLLQKRNKDWRIDNDNDDGDGDDAL